MEKETRINKYKTLRDEIKEGTGIKKVVEETVEEDDDFLIFVNNKINPDDTLSSPLTFDEIEHNKNARRIMAESKFRNETYDTRMDIYNKIKNNPDFDVKYTDDAETKSSFNVFEDLDDDDEDVKTVSENDTVEVEVVEEAEKEDVGYVTTSTLLDKLAELSSEEDQKAYEEIKKETNNFEDDLVEEESTEEKVPTYTSFLDNPIVDDEEVSTDDGEVYEEEPEKEGIFVKILNVLTIILVIIAVVILGLIVKQMFF